MANPTTSPTTSPTVIPTIYLPPTILRPSIADPVAACGKLNSDSDFEGYLVELSSNGDCPPIVTSRGTWESDDPTDCLRSACPAGFLDVGDAYYVASSTQPALCRYKRKPQLIFPIPTAAERYEALAAALGYPNQASRGLLGILCLAPEGARASDATARQAPADATAPEQDEAYIPVCRKCAQANLSSVSMPTLQASP